MRTGDFGLDVDRAGELRVEAEAVFERDVLGEAEVHGDDHDHQEARSPKRTGLVAAAARRPGCRRGGASSEEALICFFPFGFFGVGFLEMPRSLSVAAGYFSPNRFCFAAGDFAVVADARRPAGCRSRPCRVRRSRCRLRRPAAGRARRRWDRGWRAGGCCRRSRSCRRSAFSIDGPVGGRRGREALVVRARSERARGRRARACRRRCSPTAGSRRCGTSASGSCSCACAGASPASSGLPTSSVCVKSSKARRDDRVLARTSASACGGFGQRRVQRGAAAQVDGAYGEGVASGLATVAQGRRARPQQAHELGALFDERRLVGQRVDRLFQRRRTALGRFFERLRDARPGREERVLVAE